MATIPTYKDLEDKIVILEGKLRYWSGLSKLEEAKLSADSDNNVKYYATSDSGDIIEVKHIMKKATTYECK